eukprot:3941889-Rhodomonas_salina.2
MVLGRSTKEGQGPFVAVVLLFRVCVSHVLRQATTSTTRRIPVPHEPQYDRGRGSTAPFSAVAEYYKCTTKAVNTTNYKTPLIRYSKEFYRSVQCGSSSVAQVSSPRLVPWVQDPGTVAPVQGKGFFLPTCESVNVPSHQELSARLSVVLCLTLKSSSLSFVVG